MRNLKQLINYIDDLERQRDLAYKRFGSLESQAIILDEITHEIKTNNISRITSQEIIRLQNSIKINSSIKDILKIYKNVLKG